MTRIISRVEYTVPRDGSDHKGGKPEHVQAFRMVGTRDLSAGGS